MPRGESKLQHLITQGKGPRVKRERIVKISYLNFQLRYGDEL